MLDAPLRGGAARPIKGWGIPAASLLKSAAHVAAAARVDLRVRYWTEPTCGDGPTSISRTGHPGDALAGRALSSPTRRTICVLKQSQGQRLDACCPLYLEYPLPEGPARE